VVSIDANSKKIVINGTFSIPAVNWTQVCAMMHYYLLVTPMCMQIFLPVSLQKTYKN